MTRGVRLAAAGLVACLAFASLSSAAFHETRLHDCLGPVRQFADPEVSLTGTAGSFGFTVDDLRDYAREVFDERLPGMRVPGLDVDALAADPEKAKETGLLQFIVWTVRETYPVIFHIEARAGSVQCLFDGRSFYKISYLGYTPEIEMRNTVKASIREAIDKVALKFFPGRKGH